MNPVTQAADHPRIGLNHRPFPGGQLEVGGVPECTFSHEPTVAVVVLHRPAVQVNRLHAHVVDFEPIAGRGNGFVVAIRQNFREHEVC